MPSRVLTRAVSGGTKLVSKENTYTADQEQSYSFTVADASTDFLVAMTLDVSQLKLIYIVSDQAITLETNSGSAPSDTITLVADVPYVWHTGSYYTNLLATDITATYWTNASGATANVDIQIVVDPTV